MHNCVLAVIPTCTLPVGCAEFCDILCTSYELSVVIIVHFLWAVRVLRYLTLSVSCVLWCLDISCQLSFVIFCTLPMSFLLWHLYTSCELYMCCDIWFFLWAVCCDMCTFPGVWYPCWLCVLIFVGFFIFLFFYFHTSDKLYAVIFVHFLWAVCYGICSSSDLFSDTCTLPADCMLWNLYISCGLYVAIFVHFLRTVFCDIRTLPVDCMLWYSYTSCGLYTVHVLLAVCSRICTFSRVLLSDICTLPAGGLPDLPEVSKYRQRGSWPEDRHTHHRTPHCQGNISVFTSRSLPHRHVNVSVLSSFNLQLLVVMVTALSSFIFSSSSWR